MSTPAPDREARPASPSRAGAAGVVDLALALAVTFAAGMTDATGFLGFGGVFVSFMSGDTTRLGVALSARAWPSAVLFLSVVALFVLGAAVGRALAVVGGRWRRAAVLTFSALLLAMAAGAGGRGLTAAALILAVPATGALNATISFAEGVPVTPTYVTGTLVHLGQALADWALGRGGGGAAVLLPLWLAMLAGAGAGAWLFTRVGLMALAAPAGLALVLAAFAALAAALRPSRNEP